MNRMLPESITFVILLFWVLYDGSLIAVLLSTALLLAGWIGFNCFLIFLLEFAYLLPSYEFIMIFCVFNCQKIHMEFELID